MTWDSFTLVSDSLLSKWGFSDGDIFNEFLFDLKYEEGWTDLPDAHNLLDRLVRDHLLPVLDQDVVVVRFSTIHNPIRAEFVDGVDVSDCWFGEPTVELTPDLVRVPLADVLAAIQSLGGANPSGIDR